MAQFDKVLKLNRLSHFINGLILLFVLSQTAGLLHAEIHPFHEHEASCDVFDNLGQPLDSPAEYLPQIASPAPIISQSIQLRSVFEPPYFPAFFGRAPPIA